MIHDEILAWLCETDPARLVELWRNADETRRRHVGDEVHLRGLVEISNHCTRFCGYCGLRAGNRRIERYRMSKDEIFAAACRAVDLGYGTIVLQSGEDPDITVAWMDRLIRRVKAETPLAVTLSLGERTPDELAAWRAAGADRYLLKFETSNPRLYAQIHPPRAGQSHDRMSLLTVLRDLGYEVGSGAMVGIPGQTHDDLARDIGLFRLLDLDMVGVGPYVPHPDTPLGRNVATTETPDADIHIPDAGDQVPHSELMTCKVVALTRLVCPWANIPATTALATTAGESGRLRALARGANVVMPNLTPPAYRRLYAIYPGKDCPDETAEACADGLARQIASIGRRLGLGRGDSRNYNRRLHACDPSAIRPCSPDDTRATMD
ncbi:MAG: [FeFe] hydrogenase H-cluster radical SAM maturase HydE [Pirellulales bacterium]|nr:[FeFe] hydrogenase H-cluster radical SAM maturase HydE [Pirellulales bacterium]